jgi:caffeoyl-CoA O-methyltransferase
MDVMPDLRARDPFDLVFIDGNKERYATYFELATPLLARRGLIVVDDVFFHGDALNAAPSSEKGRGSKAMLEAAAAATAFDRLLLPVGNGLMLLQKQDR